MKRIIVLLLILITSLSIYSIDFPGENDPNQHYVKVMPVYFFADIEAFFGFTGKAVTSLGAVTDQDNFDFEFNTVTENYETPEIHFYIQAFQGVSTGTNYDWTVTLDGKIINETDSTETISYNVRSYDIPENATFTTASDEIKGTLTIKDNKPDYQQGWVILSIPGDTEFDKNVSYKGTLTMKLEVE